MFAAIIHSSFIIGIGVLGAVTLGGIVFSCWCVKCIGDVYRNQD